MAFDFVDLNCLSVRVTQQFEILRSVTVHQNHYRRG